MRNFVILFLCLIFTDCALTSGRVSDTRSVVYHSSSVVGIDEYVKINITLRDTFNNWIRHQLPSCAAEMNYEYNIDSVICLNNKGNRLIALRFLYAPATGSMDDISYILGEKINENWYFFSGSSQPVMRKKDKATSQPIPHTYFDLHKIAMEDLFRAYLNSKGEINEEWFNAHFEDSGWGYFDKKVKVNCPLHKRTHSGRREFFEDVHMEVIKNNWNRNPGDTMTKTPPLP